MEGSTDTEGPTDDDEVNEAMGEDYPENTDDPIQRPIGQEEGSEEEFDDDDTFEDNEEFEDEEEDQSQTSLQAWQ